jgi:hypothetical protein
METVLRAVLVVIALAAIWGAAFLASRKGWDKDLRRGQYVGPTSPTVTIPPHGGKVIGRIAPAADRDTFGSVQPEEPWPRR